MGPLEVELRVFGVGRNWDAVTWELYRAREAENPHGGMAAQGPLGSTKPVEQRKCPYKGSGKHKKRSK